MRSYAFIFSTLFVFSSLTAQKATIDLKNGFQYINLNDDKIHIEFLAHDKFAIATNGIPVNNIYFNLKNELLDIHLKKQELTGEETIVILYPKNKPAPKVVTLSEWVSIDTQD
jgi:hypothetical protein